MEREDLLQDIEVEDQEEWLRQLRRKQRIEEMRRRKKRTQQLHRLVAAAAAVLLLFAGLGVGALVHSALTGSSEKSEESPSAADDEKESNMGQEVFSALSRGIEALPKTAARGEESLPEYLSETVKYYPFTAYSTESTAGIGDGIVSEYGVLIDIEEGIILAGKNPHARISPASMTKILTVLTAAELLGVEDENSPVLDEEFTMTVEITDYAYVNDCSSAYFEVGEQITVRDLFYGTILPSGADAAVGLAVFSSGSQEAFVERMNEKLKELGLSDTTHFTNCVGLYDDSHYSTVYDMAVLMKEASDNEFCRQVLSAHTYTTSPTEQHPEGIMHSNWFLRRIEDKDTHGEVLCGKTGFVVQSGNCAASLAADNDGREYLCVTAGAGSSGQCINDQTALYQIYLPAETIDGPVG